MPGLPQLRQIFYKQSHKGNPRILAWVVCPFFSRSFWPGIKPESPALQADSLPTEFIELTLRDGHINWLVHYLAKCHKRGILGALSSPITSWKIDGETMNIVTNFIFLGSKITTDDDCCHEIKRLLLLGRKAMTSLDNILKSRDIFLLTKIRLVKAMYFPVVICGCES